MDKPEGWQNIISRTLGQLDFAAHPGLCGKCDHALWSLEKSAGNFEIGYAACPYLKTGEFSLYCQCKIRGHYIGQMVFLCDSFLDNRVRFENMRGHEDWRKHPDGFYYFGDDLKLLENIDGKAYAHPACEK